MTDAERQAVRTLIANACDGDTSASLQLEQRVLTWDASKRVADAGYVLDRLALLGLTALRERILARLSVDPFAPTDDRPTWVA